MHVTMLTQDTGGLVCVAFNCTSRQARCQPTHCRPGWLRACPSPKTPTRVVLQQACQVVSSPLIRGAALPQLRRQPQVGEGGKPGRQRINDCLRQHARLVAHSAGDANGFQAGCERSNSSRERRRRRQRRRRQCTLCVAPVP